jgi:hypothetical protein
MTGCWCIDQYGLCENIVGLRRHRFTHPKQPVLDANGKSRPVFAALSLLITDPNHTSGTNQSQRPADHYRQQ